MNRLCPPLVRTLLACIFGLILAVPHTVAQPPWQREGQGPPQQGQRRWGRPGEQGETNRFSGEPQRGQESPRRGFDPTEFLKRLDRNQSGFLDPDEMQGRARGLIENLGFDVSRPINLDSISQKIQNDRRALNRERAQQAAASVERKVPGFGEPQELQGVPGFGVEGETQTIADFSAGAAASRGGSSIEDEYGEDVANEVERSLRRYDRDGNRIIDREELRVARFSSPSAEESDTNGDGQLTEKELAERYKLRSEQRTSESENESGWRPQREGNDSNGPGDWRSRRGGSEGNDRGRSEDSRSSGRSDSSARPGPSTAPSSSSLGRSRSERTRRYVEDLMKKYDKDSNGALEGDELKEIRIPLKEADGDSDGRISAGEMNQYFGGSTDTSSSSESRASTSERSSRPQPSRSDKGEENRIVRATGAFESVGGLAGGTGEASQAGLPSRFQSRDSDQDGQIQMWEFESSWTREKIEEFRRYDSNGDGVITPREFAADGR